MKQPYLLVGVVGGQGPTDGTVEDGGEEVQVAEVCQPVQSFWQGLTAQLP